MNKVSSSNAPSADHILSQAIVSNGIVFVSGQIHQNADGSLSEGTVAEKLDRIFSNIDSILREAGTSRNKIIKITIYVTDMEQMVEINENYAKYFDLLPAREAIGVVALPLGATIEIAAIAEL